MLGTLRLTLPIIWAAGGHWSLAVSLGSQALQSPSRQRLADFTRAQHDGNHGGGFPCPLRLCIFKSGRKGWIHDAWPLA